MSDTPRTDAMQQIQEKMMHEMQLMDAHNNARMVTGTPLVDAALSTTRYDPAMPSEAHQLQALMPIARQLERDLTALRERLAAAEKFAVKMFDLSDWPDGGDIDGFDFQEAATACGLLTPEQRTEACGENCSCAENTDEWPVTCYRKSQWLIDAARKEGGGG